MTTWWHFQGEEKKVMYIMLTEWKHDIRYKTALLCLDCVECARKWIESQWSACRVSFNPSETLIVVSWMIITSTV